ncbi:MAG: hypothetical protein JOZ24_12890, partial [Candidatus Eremiobacteraeota bacterium]|nr:hypothetical protein [Candidatus Eremiobacteraeota bacterium]
MTAGVTVAGALAGGSLGIGAAALAVAVRAGAAARSERLAARLVRERERGTIEAARRLAIAASASVEAVYAEIERSARRAAAAVDGVLVFERRDDALRCVHAGGSRFAYFDGSEIALDDAGALPVRSLRDGHRISL